MNHNYKILAPADIKSGDKLIHCICQNADLSGIENVTALMCDLTSSAIPASWTLDRCITALPVEDTEAAIQAEVQEAVDRIAELSFKYPDKVSKALTGKVDKTTTEGLLSANGKPKTIHAPEGW